MSTDYFATRSTSFIRHICRTTWSQVVNITHIFLCRLCSRSHVRVMPGSPTQISEITYLSHQEKDAPKTLKMVNNVPFWTLVDVSTRQLSYNFNPIRSGGLGFYG